MRSILRRLLLVFLACIAVEAVAAPPSATPVEVVNRRMQLYNSHDVEAMLSLYSPDATVFTYPDFPLGKGKEHLRKVFGEIFSDTGVRVRIERQISIDRYVINEELVSYAGKPTKYVSIYEVRDGLIASVRFVRN